jgi:hypothetical protein
LPSLLQEIYDCFQRIGYPAAGVLFFPSDRMFSRRLLPYRRARPRYAYGLCQSNAEFLAYSRSEGNDLVTPRLDNRFAGLKPGDKWCLCAVRWMEAFQAGVAPPVHLEGTHAKALEIIPLEVLRRHAL